MNVEINIGPKEIYEPLYNPPEGIRYIDLWGGRTRGGSFEGTLYALYRLTSPAYARIALVRQVHRDIESSLWQDFKDRAFAEEEGVCLNEKDFRISDHKMQAEYKHTGNTIKAFGLKADSKRTAKIKSIAGFNVVIIEEADELTEDDFNQLNVSLRTTKGDHGILIVRIFNPPGKQHWIWRDYNLTEAPPPPGITQKEFPYWKAEPKSNSRVLSIFSTYRDNIDNIDELTVDLLEGFKDRKPEYYWTMVEGLISEGQRGRIYSGWEPISFAAYQEIESREIGWLDFGHSESPMAFGTAKFENNRVYCHELIYEPITLKQLAIQFCILGIKELLIIADAAEPDSIRKLRTGWKAAELTPEEMEKYPQLLRGFNVIKCVKGPGSVKAGIGQVQDTDVYVTEESENIWNEYREYKWALDKDKNPTDVPAEGDDHHMDGMRYVISGRGRLF